MSNVISLDNINSKSVNKDWLIVKVNQKGEETKTIHKPKLAERVAKSCNYRQFKKVDFMYNGKYFISVDEEEFIQKRVKTLLDKEELNYSFNTITDVIKMMKADYTVDKSSDKRYLSLKDCVLDVDTLEKTNHSPKFFTTSFVDTEFKEVSEEEYQNSYLKKYFDGVFNYDTSLTNQAFEVLGMCLSPDPKKFQECIVLEGEGSNGKSVFMDLIRELVGKACSTVPFKDIDGNRFALSQMVGKTVNIDPEVSGSKLEDTSNFKAITGGDDVTVEQKGKDSFTGKLDILLVFSVNKMPLAADKTHGFARRFNIIPFASTFVDNPSLVSEKKRIFLKDKELFYKIISEELHILLYKAIEGLQRLKRTNYTLSDSKAVEEATKQYRITNNNVEGFFIDNREGKHVYSSISAKALYSIYREWCENNETSPTTVNQFGSLAKNFVDKKRSSGGNVYVNVTLHHDSEWLRQKEYI